MTAVSESRQAVTDRGAATATAARVLEGGAIAGAIRERVSDEIATFQGQHGFVPTLAIVMVGRDEPSAVYAEQILRTCRRVGARGRLVELPGDATAGQLRARIDQLNADPLVSGIIVQMPLPPHIPLRAVIDTINPNKDIDGIHPLNAGLLTLGYQGFLPACAEAAVEIVKRSGYVLEGLNAVVIGRSNVVGKPVELLLLREHCTVTVCHRRTRDLAAHTRAADLVVVGAGAPRLVRGDMLRPGALVVDVGINVVDDGIVGDVERESAIDVAAALTPVPGGVGPITNALLLDHLVRAARTQTGVAASRSLPRSAGLALEPVPPS